MFFYLRWLEEMAKLRGLGKGLDALLTSSNVSADVASIPLSSASGSYLDTVKLDLISAGKYQPRRIFDEAELQELSDSIKQNGIIQPIVLRKLSSGYEIIAGERRWRAAKMAGFNSIPAFIREFSDEEALVISLIENVQRKDLSVIEEARGYKRLTDEFKLTHQELAKSTGKSRSHITNILRLLNLHPEVQEMLLLGQLDMGHARALLPLEHKFQYALALEVVDNDLTTAAVERMVNKIIQNPDLNEDERFKMVTLVNPDVKNLEDKIADRLGMMVAIKHSKNGNGKVVLKYNSLEELDTLLNLIK